jgi:hypothetical protein
MRVDGAIGPARDGLIKSHIGSVNPERRLVIEATYPI